MIITRKCSVQDCKNTYYSNMYCKKHYRLNCIPTEYRALYNIKQRCCNPNCKEYKDYGGRGIRVCDEWLHNFKAFHDYVGDKPTPKHSIDRIDNNGNYEPGNVRWATRHKQGSNKRNNNKVVGVSYHKLTKKWQSYLMVNNVRVLYKSFKSYNDAVNSRKKAEELYHLL